MVDNCIHDFPMQGARCLSGAGSCHAAPECAPSERAAAEPCNSWLAAVNQWVASSGLRAEVTPATLCPHAPLGVRPQWQHVPPAWGQFGGFANCQAHIRTPASCPSLMSHCRRAPSSLMVLSSHSHCTHDLHNLGGFRWEWIGSAVKDNPTNNSWISLGRKWATLIDAHSHFVYYSTTGASAPHKTQKLGGFLHRQKAKHCWFPFPS